MGWFSKPAAKPAPAKLKAPVKGISKDKTRVITRRIEKPISEKGRFYLKPMPCSQAWDFAERGGIYDMAANGIDDETIARRTGLSLFDVRRAIAGPWFRQVDVQPYDPHTKHCRRTISLLGWDENSIPDGSRDDPTPWENLYLSPADIARYTGLVHDGERYIIRFDAGGFTHSVTLPVYNPKSSEYGKFFGRRTKAVKSQGETYNQQVRKLRKSAR